MSAAVAWACAQHAWIQTCLRTINEDDATRDAVHGGIARRRLLHRQRKARAATDAARERAFSAMEALREAAMALIGG